MRALLYPAAVVLAGYVVLGITGFGSALVIVPLQARHWPLAEVVTLTLLLVVSGLCLATSPKAIVGFAHHQPLSNPSPALGLLAKP